MSSNGAINDAQFQLVADWLFAQHGLDPVDSDWVPGASASELMRLANLGALLAALVRGSLSAASVAFAADAVQTWLDVPLTPPSAVVEATRMILAEDKEQGLAAIYATLVSAPSRRTLGTFFTPTPEVDWMINEWSRAHDAPHAVVDVGAGVGAYTAAAATKWPDAGIWAVDVNPVTLGLLAIRVVGQFALKVSDDEQPGVRLALEDFTRWMTSTWPSIHGPRLILGNPPYTRLQLLPQHERDRLHEAGGGLCGRRASLSTLIAAQSLLALGSEDGMSLLLPAHWLEAEYAKGLREELWASRYRKVTMRLFDDGLFDDARVDAVALTVGPVQEGAQPFECQTDDSAPTFTTMHRDKTAPAEFRSLFTPQLDALVQDGVRLGDVLEVRRGTATGANAFFALTVDEAEKLRLPPSVLRPLVRRTFAVPDKVTPQWLEARPRSEKYVLLDMTANDLLLSPELRSYVKAGEDEDLPARHLCRARRDWRVLGAEIVTPDLLIGQSTRKKFRVLENVGGAAILNNLYGLSWRTHISVEHRERVVHWLRSVDGQRALQAGARSHGSGLWKIEPGAVKNVRIPAQILPDPHCID